MEEIFVRFPVTDNLLARHAEKSPSRSKSDGNVVCVREYFPETFQTAVRQKSRWIIGIVFQGFKTHRWTDDWRLNYFLWRDRKTVTLRTFDCIAFTQLLAYKGLRCRIHESPQNAGFTPQILIPFEIGQAFEFG